MYLSRLYVKHYRSLKELDISFSKGKNVLIGRNNTGKSNIIKAIDLLLGEASPTYARGENITENDFYSWKEKKDDELILCSANDIFVWCELQRDEGEVLNYDELYKCFGFYVYSEIVSWENRRPVKQPVRIPKDLMPFNYEEIFSLAEDSSEKEYVNPKLRHQKTFEQQFEERYSFAFAFLAKKEGQGGISKDVRFLYRENTSEDWILAFRAPIRNELLQSAIIPSFRDPQNQLRLSSWTWYGKLMKHLTSDHEKSSELKEAFDQVKLVADCIFEKAKTTVVQSAIDVAFPGTELHFQFNADTKTELYKTCLIYVDDGFKSQLTEKGSGIQSATIIGLFNYYTRHVNTITSALLCIEEPEIYLHPHARRVISDRLDEFLDNNKNQVILSTHSVEFVRTASDDLNVILVNKGSGGTQATPISIREFKGLLFENNQNELFFADKVIICEGFDDFILKAVAKELFPKQLDEQNVSVVSVGSKDNISRLVRLVLRLGLKCFIFVDFDYLLRDKLGERDKYGAKAHENILSVGETFFCQDCILKDQGKKAYSFLQKLREELKKEEERAFYTAKRLDQCCNSKLPQVLSNLRKNGICILSGEIEDCSKDGSFMSQNDKLSLDKIFDLNERLTSGTKIMDLLETTEIQEFLQVVFSR